MTITTELVAEMTTWRHHLHQNPEFGFEEFETAAFIEAELRRAGITQIETGIGGTGLVATLQSGNGPGAIALRADMDALRIQEVGTPPHRSQKDGLMHACGHDGHVAMLLGAAKHLAATPGSFNGTVHFIFQPAEEWGQGMRAMLDDGLLKRFPIDAAYGLHNMPGLPEGEFATRTGPIMAAEDLFDIQVAGSGGHSSRPHHARDALLAAASIVTALQTVVARHVPPIETAVLSVTEMTTDGTRNAIASNADIKGDCRSYLPAISQLLEGAITRISQETARIHGCTAKVQYTREFIPTLNSPAETECALAAARSLAPTDPSTAMVGASEDFAQILETVPGNFMFLGAGPGPVLHHAEYDFNDRLLPLGAAYFVRLVETALPTSSWP